MNVMRPSLSVAITASPIDASVVANRCCTRARSTSPRCIAWIAAIMNRHATTKAAMAATSEMLLKAKPGEEPIKNQSARAAARNMEIRPGPSPPNHALAATAGKKKINGSELGPMACVSASLAIQPTKTVAIATPYRCQVGRASIDVFESNASEGRMLLDWCRTLESFRTKLLEVFCLSPNSAYAD